MLHSGEKNINCDYFMFVDEADYKLNNSQLYQSLFVVRINSFSTAILFNLGISP